MNSYDAERERAQVEAMRRYVLPLAAVAETIATQGKSAGNTALMAEQNFVSAEERARQAEKDRRSHEESDRRSAMERKLSEAQIGKIKREGDAESRRIEAQRVWSDAIDSDESLSPVEKEAYKQAGPEMFLSTMVKKSKPDPFELLSAQLAGQRGLQRERIASQEKIAGQKIKSKEEESKRESQPQMDFKNDLVDQLKVVINHPGKFSGASIGHIAQIGPTKEKDFSNQFKKLKSMLTLENLKYLKGAMSDKDVAFIRQASSALDLGTRREDLDSELNKILAKLTSTVKVENKTTEGKESNDEDPLGIR